MARGHIYIGEKLVSLDHTYPQGLANKIQKDGTIS